MLRATGKKQIRLGQHGVLLQQRQLNEVVVRSEQALTCKSCSLCGHLGKEHCRKKEQCL